MCDELDVEAEGKMNQGSERHIRSAGRMDIRAGCIINICT
jgi:hypothetical protein